MGCHRAALLRGILRRENPTYMYWRRAARASRGLKLFYLLSRRKTFVGGKCALPSALLVFTMPRCPGVCPVPTLVFLSLRTNTKRILMKFAGVSHYHQQVNCLHY